MTRTLEVLPKHHFMLTLVCPCLLALLPAMIVSADSCFASRWGPKPLQQESNSNLREVRKHAGVGGKA